MSRWARVARSKWLRGVAGIIVLAGLTWGVDRTWRDLSWPHEKRSLEGVPNFGQLKPTLFRGGQPSDEGLVNLRAMGIEAIVSFTLGEEGTRLEAALAAKLGMDFLTLPWSTEEVPEPETVTTFLNYLREHPERKVFVHCKAGADRTGTMIALSRIALDGWPAQQAIDEMNAFHYHFIFLPHLQRFVENFQPNVLP